MRGREFPWAVTGGEEGDLARPSSGLRPLPAAPRGGPSAAAPARGQDPGRPSPWRQTCASSSRTTASPGSTAASSTRGEHSVSGAPIRGWLREPLAGSSPWGSAECYYLSDGETWPEVMGRRLEPELRDPVGQRRRAGRTLDLRPSRGAAAARAAPAPEGGALPRGRQRSWHLPPHLVRAGSSSHLPPVGCRSSKRLSTPPRGPRPLQPVLRPGGERPAGATGAADSGSTTARSGTTPSTADGPVAIDRGDVERAAARLSGPLQAYREEAHADRPDRRRGADGAGVHHPSPPSPRRGGSRTGRPATRAPGSRTIRNRWRR